MASELARAIVEIAPRYVAVLSHVDRERWAEEVDAVLATVDAAGYARGVAAGFAKGRDEAADMCEGASWVAHDANEAYSIACLVLRIRALAPTPAPEVPAGIVARRPDGGVGIVEIAPPQACDVARTP